MINSKFLMTLSITVLCTASAWAISSEKLPSTNAAKAAANPKEQPDFSSNTGKNKKIELPMAQTPEGWTSSLKKAMTSARAENKYILAFFTGSDWCKFCEQLEDEVFKTPEFKDWAEKNVIKLFLDFPKSHQLPQNIKSQNVAMAQRLGIGGFPTVVFFTPQGQPLTSIGYLPGGGSNWIKHVEMLLPKTKKVENSFSNSLAMSKKEDKPLLLGIYNSRSKDAINEKKNIEQVFSTPELLLPSGKEIVLAQIDYTKLSPAEKKLLSTVSENDSYPKYILLNSKMEAIFSSENATDTPNELAKEITTFLPKPKYDGKWLSDYTEGLKLARLYNKPLLLFFTGSDWCVYCKEMKDKIFNTEIFSKKAKDFILVELDFPRSFTLPENINMQNAVISDAYGIEGFPTIVVEKSNGMPVGAFGYSNQDVTEFFKTVDKALGI